MSPIDEARQYVEASDLRDVLGCASGEELAVEPLGQGEHNANFLLRRPTGEIACVLRMSYSSQLGLANQVLYEACALELLHDSSRAPRLLFADDSHETACRGVLAIEYCSGRRLEFENDGDLSQAAECLAQVHALDPFAPAGECRAPVRAREGLAMPALQQPDSVLEALLEEDRRMCARYRSWAKADARVVAWLDRFENACARFVDGMDLCPLRPSVVNTECIAAHFLIDEARGYAHMVDWEKAIVGDAAQDVAYFLAPTTTIWDDDFIFTEAQRARFMESYLAHAGLDSAQAQIFTAHCDAFMPLICLRGISWCAAAKIDYDDPNTLLKNEKTAVKIEEYLSEEFLQRVFDEHYRGKIGAS